ncbi:uncharacterized protein BYT42DRAFT_189494 [Radiomyces spectabilis]|uniref:uncharacterized protein n=1 Tax=Radiomyces spectabilis TaxID=64574 RepID=UPI00221EC378|nr:uncharacterized protein BYT42DRAFT_189494 [Radiomyces spectabilis]KAI8391305.1 hypothetical protein BYT42DRAFT_189494 [Radiomyces spectabilis]
MVPFRLVRNNVFHQILKRDKTNALAGLRIAKFLLLDRTMHDIFSRFLDTQLDHHDKKSQLAAVMILDYICSQWPTLPEAFGATTHDEVLAILDFYPSVMRIIEKNSDQPNLLSCKAYDVVLNLSAYATLATSIREPTARERPASDNESIVMIEEVQPNQHGYDKVRNMWRDLFSLLQTMDRWARMENPVDKAILAEIQQLFSVVKVMLSEGNLDALNDVGHVWFKWTRLLKTKPLLSKKAVVVKKRLASLESTGAGRDCGGLALYSRMVTLAMMQKGAWKKPEDPMDTEEQNEMKLASELCQKLTNCFPLPYPYQNLGGDILCALSISVPQLFHGITLPLPVAEMLAHTDRDRLADLTDTSRQQLVTYLLQQPHATIPILINRIPPDGSSSLTLDTQLINDLITTCVSEANSFVLEIFSRELLKKIATNNTACELLIKCMPCLDLRTLILHLMQMAHNPDPRTNQVCKALIAKALMVESWVSDSILVYLDLIRDFEQKKAFVVDAGTNCSFANISPASLVNTTASTLLSSTLDDSSTQSFTMELVSVIELWSNKVKPEHLRSGLAQLVRKSYGSAQSLSLSILVWKVLSRTLLTQHQLIWVILEECVKLIKSQPQLTESLIDDDSAESTLAVQTLLYARLAPLLILLTMPNKVYDVVKLADDALARFQPSLQVLDIPLQNIKRGTISDDCAETQHELLQELIYRSQNELEYEHVKQQSKSLIMRIFCA